ncbi:GTPase IMAP family member 9-like [Scomber scombrus]|uniref:GTPase IMAP family member 9-like n=1 Tax=Scomber scombrus TaxID=13677 RepID=UPI002DDB2D62|nr:GTPase IMAP family member 9-like [Scomber scombrus]
MSCFNISLFCPTLFVVGNDLVAELLVQLEVYSGFWSTPGRPQHSTVYNNNEQIRIVMVGKTGAGKSATGNTILGRKCFESKFSPTSLTTVCEKAFSEVDGQKVAVIDTPGLFDNRYTEKETIQNIAQSIAYASPGPHIFLVVIKLDRFTEEEKQTVQKIQKIFGEEANKYSMVLFTHGDRLKGTPIKDLLKDNKDLKELVAQCNGQYHMFNNEVEDRSQVSKLLQKIRKINVQNGRSYYTTEIFQKAERAIEEKKQQILKEREQQNRKEQEELTQKTNENYKQKLREASGDRAREKKVKEEHEREQQIENTKLKGKHEKTARKLAEKSYRVLRIIFTFVPVVTSLCNYFLNDIEDEDIDIDIE